MVSEVCECNNYVFKFKKSDAGKEVICPNCGREYSIYLEIFDETGEDYELELAPIHTYLTE